MQNGHSVLISLKAFLWEMHNFWLQLKTVLHSDKQHMKAKEPTSLNGSVWIIWAEPTPWWPGT